MHDLASILFILIIRFKGQGGKDGQGRAKKFQGGQLPPLPPYFPRLCSLRVNANATNDIACQGKI